MQDCEHRPSWIRKRPDGDFYCSVCRKVLYEQITIDLVDEREVEEEFEKQRRIDRLLWE